MTLADVPEVVRMHMAGWSPNEISIKLGVHFVRLLYSVVARAEDAFVFVYENEDNEIIAASAGFLDYQGLNRRLMLNNGHHMLRAFLQGVFHGRISVRDILNMVNDGNKTRNVKNPQFHWGLTTLREDYIGTRHGRPTVTALATAVFDEMRNLGCPTCWGPCRADNIPMSKFFIRLGFRKVETFERAGGEVMEIFEKDLKETHGATS
jgi:RimJ/RimL family protein N-acetyltransferase